MGGLDAKDPTGSSEQDHVVTFGDHVRRGAPNGTMWSLTTIYLVDAVESIRPGLTGRLERVVDGELITTDLVEINLGMRILLGSSFYEDWQGRETFVDRDPLGNPIDQRHPWNQTTLPNPQKRDMSGRYSWVMSPRW